MQAAEHATAYEQFLELRAALTGRSEEEIKTEVTPQQFDEQIRVLHERYMNREFTIGKLADYLQVPVLNLVDVLDEMDLPMRYT